MLLPRYVGEKNITLDAIMLQRFTQYTLQIPMDLAYMCVKHQMRLYVCQALPPPKHQMRLYVCHQMRLYVCHQMRLLNLWRS